MAKVEVKKDCIDIRVSMVERLVLSERSRRVPLSRVRSVDPHPPVVDMVLHWADQSGVWLSGASTYEGHLVPSARNPGKTLAIDLGDDDGRIFVEVDDEPPEVVASRIEEALGRPPSVPPPATSADTPGTFDDTPTQPRLLRSLIARELAREAEEDALESAEAFFVDTEDQENVRRRDPLLQGSFAPPAPDAEVMDAGVEIERIARAGFWMLGGGTVALLTGTASVGAGMPAGLVAVGAGVASCIIGGLAIRIGAAR